MCYCTSERYTPSAWTPHTSDEQAGGDSSKVQEQLTDVKDIVASGLGFAALRAAGDVVAWGRSTDISPVRQQLIDVQQLTAAGAAFAALLRDGRVVSWGVKECGGDSSRVQAQLEDIQQVQASGAAFAALRRDGRVVTWGLPDSGGDSEAFATALVSLNEFVKLMYKYELAMWPDSTDEELARVVRVVDAAIDRWHHAAGNWYKVFLFIDTQGSGTITYEDLRRFLRGGYPDLHLDTKELPNEDVYRLWKVLDPNASMRIRKSDFLAHMR
ncbi:HERC2, partial [Symbiodinium natans]